MFSSNYGQFQSIILTAAILVTVFSTLVLKSVGRIRQWTWLIDDTPPMIVTVGVRALAIALIVVSYMLIDKTNYRFFATAAVGFGLVTMVLIGWFDSLRRKRTCQIPILNNNGTQAKSMLGRLKFKSVVVGAERDMKQAPLDEYRRHPGLSVCKFLSGYGENEINNPASIWDTDYLSGIAHKMTMILMVILLSAVMALFLAAAALNIFQQAA
jgi:hypothetical protein